MEMTHGSKAQLKGVGGWLLFLILSLSIFSPLVTLYNLVTGYEQSSRYFDRLPALLTIERIDILLSTVLMCLSIYAGILLWTIRPNAVKVAKSVLLLFIAYCVVIAIVVTVSGLPAQVAGFLVGYMVPVFIQKVIFVVVWFSYLHKSRRVQATYSVNALPQTPDEQRLDRENRVALYCASGEFEGNTVPLPTEGIVIGRSPAKAHLVLASQDVSAAHALVWPDRGGSGVWVRDMQSTNGTYYCVPGTNGAREQWIRIQEQKLLPCNGRFRIGEGVARFEVTRV